MSDLEYILGVCKACKNLRAQYPYGPNYSLSKKVQVRWVNMSVYNFLAGEQKFTKFLCLIGDEMWLIVCYSDFRLVDAFLRYSRSKSKVVKNRAKFWTFFALPNFVGGTPCESSVHLITQASSHFSGKVSWGQVHYPKVIGAPMLNFKPNFRC